MNITIQGVGLSIGDAFKSRVEDKLSKFERYFGNDASVKVKARKEGELKCLEITFKVKNHYYRAEIIDEDLYVALDLGIDVIERQIRKQKTRIEKRIRDYAYMKEYLKDQAIDEKNTIEEDQKIIKRKSFELHPMSEDEAVLQMELLDHDFHIFMNAETGKVSLIYKRKDGHYGLIEPE